MTGQERPSTSISGTGKTTTGDGGARPTTLTTTLTVNGAAAVLPASTQLLSALRDRLGLTGAKPGCGEGSCGACTVLLDGQPVRSCQLTVGSVAGQAVTTIEGLRGPDGLHPLQRAFADEDAAQCGYCIPGLIMSALALLTSSQDPGDTEIDAALAGHICRCGGYPRIRRAVHRAAATQRGFGNPPPFSRVDSAIHLGSGASYRPERPWDLTSPTDRDWFGALGNGLAVVLEPPAQHSGQWTTARGAWLHVSPSGVVTAFTGKVDVGQDNSTALRLLVAEELGVPLASVRLVMGDTDVCPFDAGTFGSRSMPDAGEALRRTAAYARGLLPVRPEDRRVEIVTGEPVLSDPAGWRQAGHEHQAGTALDAVTGSRRFVSDLSMPNLAHGAALRPPRPGATLRSLDTAVVDAWPGVTVIRRDELVGVVADDLVTARNAVAALAAVAEWDGPAAPSSADIGEYLRSHPEDGGAFKQQEGSVATALETAAIRREATFTAAYIAPAALETRVALASWDMAQAGGDDQGRVTVWTGTQTPFSVRGRVAAALAVGQQDVRVIVPPTGGAFGGKHAADIAIEAAVLARHAGKPVRVAWSRHEEFTVGTLRKASVIDVGAGATSDGQLAGWTFVNINSGPAGIATPYRVADQRLEHRPAHSPMIQGSYRGLAATANNFARESMIDELACELGVDLVKFRLDNLADERLAAVLRAVAEHVGWADRKADDRKPDESAAGEPAAGEPAAGEPAAGEPAVGWGIACGLEKEGRVATAAQVAVWPDRTVRVRRLASGYECGAIVNPAAVRRQIEGAGVMALGGALFEAIEFTDGVISNAAFSRYQVPRIGDIPPIEVILLDRPDLPSAGAGETPMIAVAPAIAGAIFDATGRRLRSLPLTL